MQTTPATGPFPQTTPATGPFPQTTPAQVVKRRLFLNTFETPVSTRTKCNVLNMHTGDTVAYETPEHHEGEDCLLFITPVAKKTKRNILDMCTGYTVAYDPPTPYMSPERSEEDCFFLNK